MSKRNIYKKASNQPSQALLEHVEAQFDADVLVHLCHTDDFSQYGERTELPAAGWAKRDRFYWYKDNGSDILAVAHLDSVQDDVGAQVTYTAAGPLVTSGALDDRLGAYVILDLLPRLGIKCDILLTTDEEMGQSTALEFAGDFTSEGQPTKQYNWIIQFDRGGDDVVMYQYETGEYAAMVEDSGAQVGMGSYSDIADLDELGCAAFNWGVGYQDYHSARSHAWLRDTFKSVARFLRFYSKNHTTFLPHQPARRRPMWWEHGDIDDADFDDADSGDWREWAGGQDTVTDFDLLMANCNDPVEADCGHMIDLNEPRTFAEFGNGQYIVCRKRCAA